MALYKLTSYGVFNTVTQENIPADPANTQYQMYLAWAAGNTADPADVIVPQTTTQIVAADLKGNPALDALVKALAAKFGVPPDSIIAAA